MGEDPDWYARSTLSKPLTKENFPSLLKKFWEQEMKKEDFKAGFTVSGIYPFDPAVVPGHAIDTATPLTLPRPKSEQEEQTEKEDTPGHQVTEDGDADACSATEEMPSEPSEPPTDLLAMPSCSRIADGLPPDVPGTTAPERTSVQSVRDIFLRHLNETPLTTGSAPKRKVSKNVHHLRF